MSETLMKKRKDTNPLFQPKLHLHYYNIEESNHINRTKSCLIHYCDESCISVHKQPKALNLYCGPKASFITPARNRESNPEGELRASLESFISCVYYL